MKFLRDIFPAVLVFAIAVAVRVPSCYESFWVDELHSTWCVWGALGDVAPRAVVGNQSPVWFWALWLWRAIAGDSEVALRMSSVLCTAASASLLCVAMTRKFNATAGLATGLVMAVETNSIFFGTELRPYASIILLATLAVCSYLGESRSVLPIAVTTLIAAVIQPTSVVVMLGVLLLAMVDSGTLQRREKLAVVAMLMGMLAVFYFLLLPTWLVRERWGAFAVAPAFAKATEVWSWLWLWLLPLLPIALFRSKDHRKFIALGLLSVVVVFAFWFLSRTQWVHLWHRRYFIGLLPVFAVLVGGSVASMSRRRNLDWVWASVILVGLMVSQGTIRQWAANPAYLAYRGEGWREAIEWVNQSGKSAIAIEAGLIEAKSYVGNDGKLAVETLDPLMREYLLCVIEGPYRLMSEDVVPAVEPDVGERSFVTRNQVRETGKSEGGTIKRFGNVSVVLQP
ncbi:hypothetical protein Pla22_08220 [Rubripirellula amarantea]|uniref:Uncharacterized protein n=1 Tax=Rubripirellula amarantea TaxID=2527999 RepID=A0A5C5WQM1_9BACT|nr:glycosyltransferase family 39 protein [Rubripirellula amarantea]TWT53194.1 hypothetical protein Pla22_08220 [Rubripirellula amarantea]